MEKTTSKTTLLKLPFLSVRKDHVLLPTNQEAMRVVIDHIGAAAILPITSDRHAILIRQFRYATGKTMLEIPAGVLDYPGELPHDAAQRECQEETGYQVKDIELMIKMYPTPGYSNELIHIYVGYQAEPLQSKVPADSEECIEVIKIPLEEAIIMAKTGQIEDAKTVLALLCVKV